MVLDAQRLRLHWRISQQGPHQAALPLRRGDSGRRAIFACGKEFAAFLIELVDGQPVELNAKGPFARTKRNVWRRLCRACVDQGLIRDREREWKAQLAQWWSKHDTALRTISALPIDEAEKQSAKPPITRSSSTSSTRASTSCSFNLERHRPIRQSMLRDDSAQCLSRPHYGLAANLGRPGGVTA